MLVDHNIETDPLFPFVQSQGYILEDHGIQTEDGYYLVLQRLLKGNKSAEEKFQNLKKSKPVLLVPGLMNRGSHWLFISPSIGLPYQLVEEGYDVWIANLRGSPLSIGHERLSPSSKEFWDFSLSEVALQDLPSTLNYVLDYTGTPTLSYIGYSLGCTLFFILLSLRPQEWKAKIKVMIALAPGIYGEHVRNLGFKSSILMGNIVGRSNYLRRRIFSSTPIAYGLTIPWISTRTRMRLGGFLLSMFGRIMGSFSPSGVDRDRLNLLSLQWPASTSLKLICHAFQCYYSNKFKEYDYGRRENRIRYGGNEAPPEYPLYKVDVPLALFASKGDEICRAQDIKKLINIFPNVILHECIEQEDFSHVDFILGNRAYIVLYPKVLEIMRQFN